jgi:hypothetical protein
MRLDSYMLTEKMQDYHNWLTNADLATVEEEPISSTVQILTSEAHLWRENLLSNCILNVRISKDDGWGFPS